MGEWPCLTGRVLQECMYWMHLTNMATMDQISRLLCWKGKQEHARYSSQLLSHFIVCVNTPRGCLFISISGAICVMEWHSSENRKWKLGQWFPPPLHCLSNEFKYGGALWIVCYWPVRKVKWFEIFAKCHFIIELFSQVLWCFLFRVGQYCSDLNMTRWEVLFALFQGGWEYITCRNLSCCF